MLLLPFGIKYSMVTLFMTSFIACEAQLNHSAKLRYSARAILTLNCQSNQAS